MATPNEQPPPLERNHMSRVAGRLDTNDFVMSKRVALGDLRNYPEGSKEHEILDSCARLALMKVAGIFTVTSGLFFFGAFGGRGPIKTPVSALFSMVSGGVISFVYRAQSAENCLDELLSNPTLPSMREARRRLRWVAPEHPLLNSFALEAEEDARRGRPDPAPVFHEQSK